MGTLRKGGRLIMTLLRRLLCATRGHCYPPVFERRQLLRPGRRHRHIRFEFQYKCSVCGRKTGWLRWSRHDTWLKQHTPEWT